VVTRLELNRIGSTVLASGLTPLGPGLLFIGSAVGDSLLIKCHEKRVSATHSAAAAIAGGQTLALPAPPVVGGDDPSAKRTKVGEGQRGGDCDP
jgi:hypothetical protein